MSSSSNSFREVVLVEYPRKGIWVIGFVSGDTKGEVQTVLKKKESISSSKRLWEIFPTNLLL